MVAKVCPCIDDAAGCVVVQQAVCDFWIFTSKSLDAHVGGGWIKSRSFMQKNHPTPAQE